MRKKICRWLWGIRHELYVRAAVNRGHGHQEMVAQFVEVQLTLLTTRTKLVPRHSALHPFRDVPPLTDCAPHGLREGAQLAQGNPTLLGALDASHMNSVCCLRRRPRRAPAMLPRQRAHRGITQTLVQILELPRAGCDDGLLILGLRPTRLELLRPIPAAGDPLELWHTRDEIGNLPLIDFVRSYCFAHIHVLQGLRNGT
mmetsp:Transcript_23108/g.61498  ORF Transcript_23108/g.61498 Transcript_23108/m.61498 type:complete len:200 (+) Transcript_23108:214-813(+)